MFTLSRNEARLLAVLAHNLGRVVYRDEISEAFGLGSHPNSDSRVNVIVSRLRSKLASLEIKPIRTVTGYGYALIHPSSEEPRPVTALHIDGVNRRAWVHGVPLIVPKAVFDLLRLLAEYENRVLPRHLIIRLLNISSRTPGSRALDVRVLSLRRALAPLAVGGVPRIETMRGVGHRLVL